MSSRARYGPTFGWLKIVSIVWFRSWSPVWPAGRTKVPGNPPKRVFASDVVQVRVEGHRVDPVVAGVGAVGGRARNLVDVPTGVDPLELVDDRLVVGGQGAVGPVLRRAVLVEQLGPDREELHDLARVVLVRVVLGGRVHVQVLAHRRVQRLLVQDVPVIAERVQVEDAQVRRHLEGVSERVLGNDDDLVERPPDALAQLVRAVERVGEEPVLDPVGRVVVAVAGVVARGRGVARPEGEERVRVARRGGRVLRGQPREPSLAEDRADLDVVRPPGRLLEEADRLGPVEGLRHEDGHLAARDRVGRAIGRPAATGGDGQARELLDPGRERQRRERRR